jgi:hypothetical protein
MIFAIGLSVIAAAAAIVCLPLVRGEPADTALEAADVPGPSWEKQKHDAYAAIRDAEFDLRMGKLSQTDYERIRSAEEARAVEALQALEGKAGKSGGEQSE